LRRCQNYSSIYQNIPKYVFKQVQRHLQLRIEAQGKYLQSVLEKAKETLGRQNLGAMGLDAAKVQLSELASRVSTESLDSKFSELKEMNVLWPQQTQEGEIIDYSMGSFLTNSEDSKRDQEIHNKGMNFRAYNGTLCEEVKENMMYLSSSNDKVLKGNFLLPPILLIIDKYCILRTCFFFIRDLVFYFL